MNSIVPQSLFAMPSAPMVYPRICDVGSCNPVHLDTILVRYPYWYKYSPLIALYPS